MLRSALSLARIEGVPWLAWRATYEGALRSGWFRRLLPDGEDAAAWLLNELPRGTDLAAWADGAWQSRAAFFGPAVGESGALQVHDPDASTAEAARIMKGVRSFFADQEVDLGSPPNWLRGATRDWSAEHHWTRVRDLDPVLGDIKVVWEPSRFAHTFRLARAYAVTQDPAIAEAWWQDVESWMAANPPARGPHWRCGQEMALRALAWVFGGCVFDAAADAERRALLLAGLHAHGVHIERVHWYAAKCVRNNHAISEAVGLYTLGRVFPSLPRAEAWARKGRAWLAEEVAWQVYEDGAYVQHSFNYARMAAQLIAWAVALARLQGDALDGVVAARGAALLKLLRAAVDERTGHAPNYGANDGTLLFPLTACAYEDYRPALAQLAAALGEEVGPVEAPWTEQAAWFGATAKGGPAPAAAGAAATAAAAAAPVAARPALQRFDRGGYFVLNGSRSRAVMRCARYRHRPSHADQLHLDVWWNGHNVFADSGTFAYNAQAPWPAFFSSTAAHNTVEADGRSQMRKGPRFSWLSWAQGRLHDAASDPAGVVVVGSHDGYAPIAHRRAVLLRDDVYFVVDDVHGAPEPVALALQWLVGAGVVEERENGGVVVLPDGDRVALRVAATSPVACDWVAGQDAPPRGWRSKRYGAKEAAPSFRAVARATKNRFVTVIGDAAAVDELPADLLAAVPAALAARLE